MIMHQRLHTRRYLIAVLVVCLSSLTLSAQWWVKPRKGLWLSLDLDAGKTLLKQDAVLKQEAHPTTGLGLTVGYHFKSIRSLSIGLGLQTYEYASPDELSYLGLHLMLRYSPILTLEALRVSTRFGIIHQDGDTNLYGNSLSFDPKLWADISLGWECRNIFNSIGIQPAIGVSLLRYNYYSPSSNGGYPTPRDSGKGFQVMPFIRLSILGN